MKSCNGCKYLVKCSTGDLCSHDDPETNYEVNPYTGRTNVSVTGYFRPKVTVMRSEKGHCGPEATLYSPTMFRKFILWISGKRET